MVIPIMIMYKSLPFQVCSKSTNGHDRTSDCSPFEVFYERTSNLELYLMSSSLEDNSTTDPDEVNNEAMDIEEEHVFFNSAICMHGC